MAFTLPELRFPHEALEPHIDSLTMQIHHGKHHATYVANLNKALEGAAAEPSGARLLTLGIEELLRNLDSVPEKFRQAVRNNGGGHLNHSLFWESLAPGGGPKPTGSLASAIERDLGGFDAMKAELIKAGLGRFGSGWSWLSLDAGGKLVAGSTPNQDSPLDEGLVPLLGIDVWEHAYYLKYQNRRADYLEAIFNVIDWKTVSRRFEVAQA